MLKIEVIKFEAQDVITASTACTHEDYSEIHLETDHGPAIKYVCNDCGYSEIWLDKVGEQ